jgi:hypothetical protein
MRRLFLFNDMLVYGKDTGAFAIRVIFAPVNCSPSSCIFVSYTPHQSLLNFSAQYIVVTFCIPSSSTSTAAGFIIKATIPSLLLIVHEVIVEGSGTAFVISVSSSSTVAVPASCQACDRHLYVPIGHVHTQGYFHKYVAFSSFDAAETR